MNDIGIGTKKNRGHINGTRERNEEALRGADRGFGLVMAALLAVIALWPPLFSGGPFRLWALILAVSLLALALTVSRVLAPFNKAWLRFGLLMGRIVNPVVLGLIFYVVVTPFGLVMRLFGRDPLRLNRDPQATSYWIERHPPGPPPESMQNQF